MVHGTLATYCNLKCRCRPCREANAHYYRVKEKAKSRFRATCPHDQKWYSHGFDTKGKAREKCSLCSKTRYTEKPGTPGNIPARTKK